MSRTNGRALARVVLAAAVFLSACFHGAQPGESEEPVYRPDPIPLQVKNENYLDVNIFAVVNGLSRRLGTVNGNTTQKFNIPWNFANGQPISITATPIGGSGSASSGMLQVGMGQMIDFRVASLLRQSTASVHEPDI